MKCIFLPKMYFPTRIIGFQAQGFEVPFYIVSLSQEKKKNNHYKARTVIKIDCQKKKISCLVYKTCLQGEYIFTHNFKTLVTTLQDNQAIAFFFNVMYNLIFKNDGNLTEIEKAVFEQWIKTFLIITGS